jgi:hypothetical protein
LKKDKTDEQFLDLRDAIILQAVEDYKAITSGRLKETESCNRVEILEFFRNDCYGLLEDVDGIRGMDIFKIIRYRRHKRTNKTAARRR